MPECAAFILCIPASSCMQENYRAFYWTFVDFRLVSFPGDVPER
jgi:hypothetical protein